MSDIFEIGLYHYLVLALVLFCIGLYGVIVCKNTVKILICLGLILNSVALNFSAFAVYSDLKNLDGLVFAFVITIFAAFALIQGAVLLISLYKYKKSNNVEKMTDIKG